MIALMDQYSDDEFAKIVAESSSYKDCLMQLGYKANSGDNTNRLRKKIESLGLDISHFTNGKQVRKLSPEVIFVENSTVVQKVLRNWYKKGEYTPYVCSICGQEPMWQGKPMTLILDHINGHNTDDRLENLRWVCPNCNQQLDTTNGKNKIRKEHVINKCVDCGKIIGPKSTRCMECYSKFQIKELPISREELKNLIRTESFLSIGRKFGVSDNAIRKWCDKYNLPRKVTGIKNYSDEEWQNI